MNFTFIATDDFELSNFYDIGKFVDAYPDFQSVILNDTSEFKLLLELIGINDATCIDLDAPDFPRYWNLSNFQLPEFDKEQFDLFYENWLRTSGRDNNMDEYGNLIFLCGMSSKWNKLKNRLIVEGGD
jgi:hypothetical protein